MVPPCDDIPDFELIRRMADKEADFVTAREAWGRFYVRHQRFLLRVCVADHQYLFGMDEVRDLVNDAFMKAFSGAHTFDYTEECEPIAQERKSRRWLACIVANLVRDRFRGQPDVCLVDEDEIERLGRTTDGSGNETPVPESKRLKLLISGLALLSDTEQTVLRATMFYWQGDQQHQRMPHHAMQELSKQVAESPENIRQIRSRAIIKLKKYIIDNLNNEKTD